MQVTDEMVEKACAQHWPGPWPGDRSEQILAMRRDDMRAALTAALSDQERAAEVKALGTLTGEVSELVVAAREFWDLHNDLSAESRALDRALEAFADRVPYENEPEDVRAAADAYVEAQGFEHSGGIIERAFEAGAAFARSALVDAAVEVKKLTWVEDGKKLRARMVDREYLLNISADGETWAGCTRVYVIGHDLTWSSVPNCSRVSLLQAKAAAQADYEKRIRSALVDVPVEPVAASAWLIEDGTDHAWFTVIPSKAQEAEDKGCEVTPLYTRPPHREGEDSAEVERLTRPIVGIEHRTAQEVFDIMADRIRLAATRSGSATGHSGGDHE